MKENEVSIFGSPVDLVRTVGDLVDRHGNRFQMVVTGRREDVEPYLKGLSIQVEARPLPLGETLTGLGIEKDTVRRLVALSLTDPQKALEELSEMGVEPETIHKLQEQFPQIPEGGFQQGSEDKPEEEPSPEEEANTLAVEIRLVDLRIETPYELEISVDPNLPTDKVHTYILPYADDADVTCDCVRGNVGLKLAEKDTHRDGYHNRCDGGAPAGDGKRCHRGRNHSGYWKITVTGKEADSEYNLTGSTRAVGVDINQ